MSVSNSLVSLIVGCYNGEKYIERAFNSILEQTYRPIELIFINDGSQDGSLLKAQTFNDVFKKKDIDFKIINQENQGYYSTSGIKKAIGAYITTFDVDDYLMPDSIESRVSFLEKNKKYLAVRTNGYEVNEYDLEDTSRLFVVDEVEKQNDEIFEDLLFGRTNNWAGSYMVRASALFGCYTDHIVPGSRFGQNLQILMPVAYNGKVGFIDKPLMKYIRNSESFTGANQTYEKSIKQYESFKGIRLLILEMLNISNQDLIQDLDNLYLKIFIDTAFNYSKKEAFNFYFNQIMKPTISEKIKYHIINENTFMALLYRVLNKVAW